MFGRVLERRPWGHTQHWYKCCNKNAAATPLKPFDIVWRIYQDCKKKIQNFLLCWTKHSEAVRRSYQKHYQIRSIILSDLIRIKHSEAVVQRYSVKKVFLKKFRKIIVRWRFEPSILQTIRLYDHPHFSSFFPNIPSPRFWQDCPNETPDKHRNKLMSQSCFFIFRRLKNNAVFYKKTFKSDTRLRFDKNEHSKWKTSITAKNSLHY